MFYNPLLKNGIRVVKPDYGTAEEIDEDAIRRTLDEMFARDVLGLDESILQSDGPLEILRMKLPRESSIRGHKQGCQSKTM